MAAKKPKNNIDLRVISEEQPKFVSSFVRLLTKHQDILGYTLVGVLVAAAVIILMNYNKNMKNQEASVSLQSAFKLYQQDLAASTISFKTETDADSANPEVKVEAKSPGAFQSVFDNYPGTYSGQNALYMVAVSDLNTGAADKALDTFDRFLSEYPKNPLAPSAALGKATALFNLNRTAESLQLLNQIEADYPNFKLMDVVVYEKAIRQEALDQWDEARTSYQLVIDRYPDSSWKTMSETALKKLDKKQTTGSGEAA